MTQLEKDRLIEKFMGWKIDWTNDGLKWINSDGKTLGKTCYYDSTIGFTTDWNWLMRALKKFDNLYEYWEEKDGFIMKRQIEYRNICDQIDYALTLYHIDDAVNALCEGILWYNSIKNDQEG